MKQWKWFTSWALIGGGLLLAGGIIFYYGYLGNLYLSSQVKIPSITNETNQAVLAPSKQERQAEKELILQAEVGEMTAVNKASDLRDFPCPAKGRPSRGVGNYYSKVLDGYILHAGTDYVEQEGTIIRATHGGRVIFAGADPLLGQKVTVDCGEGWLITYGGLDNLRVQVGKTVETQDALGQVGLFNAGQCESDQPQLHYEVWHGDEVQTLQ